MSTPEKRFEVALSFPGEHRDFVQQIANHLAGKVGRGRVLYDKFYEAEFARPNLDTHLQRLYHDESELIAVFLCADYERKEWCGLEWRAIRDLIKKRQASSVMPLRFDDTEIPGLFSIDGYVSIGNREPREVADLIVQRMQLDSQSSNSAPTPLTPALTAQIAAIRGRLLSETSRAQLRRLLYECEALPRTVERRILVGDIRRALSWGEGAGVDSCGPVRVMILRAAPTRLRHGADRLFGRDRELAALDQAWDDPAKHVVTIVAWGGVGKTSLVVEWMARKSAAGWPGFERVFDWSFYSQGTREQGADSSDTFIAEALTFFGDEPIANSPASPWDKGARLAQLVRERRTLLVLDGVEPLQYPPGPLAGKLKDPALEVLLKGLAQQNPGLCVVTTREHVTDLEPFQGTTAPKLNLEYLSDEAGAALLHRAGANRAGAVGIKPDDGGLRAMSREVGGHALTLRLLGTYLAKAHHGDIRKRDRVKFERADAKTQGGHAFKMMWAYEKWLSESGDDGTRALAALRLLGLFDRPADAGCIAALRLKPAIAGLTEPLVGLDDEDWNIALSWLADCGLVSVQSDQSAIDAHPLIREYFAKQLQKKNSEGWRSAHQRLFEHLTESTKYKPRPTLEDLQPLYQAVFHGCQAGLLQQACQVYSNDICSGDQSYSLKYLGAFGSDLGVISCFFDQPWKRISPALSQDYQAWLLNEAGYCLSNLGRMTEASEPLRASMEICVLHKDWQRAAIRANNLSENVLAMGDVPGAVGYAEQSVGFADRSHDGFQRATRRTVLADALHQAGRRAQALALAREAEGLQIFDQPEHPELYSIFGFRYWELLLGNLERAAWQSALRLRPQTADLGAENGCNQIERRAATALEIVINGSGDPIGIALSHLTLGRAALYRAALYQGAIIGRAPTIWRRTLGLARALMGSKTRQGEALRTARKELADAVDGLRRVGQQDHIPRALLSRAWLRVMESDTDGARADLDEAWQIAERGPMRLHMADIHLYRSRLFHRVTPYPWNTPEVKSAKDDLAAARKLIEECGYHRRDEELGDAERAIG
jgi:tetratricopeptide (TPR) repeat protein